MHADCCTLAIATVLLLWVSDHIVEFCVAISKVDSCCTAFIFVWIPCTHHQCWENISQALWNDIDIDISSFPGAAEVGFSLKGTTYQNNSIVMLENIGEGGDSLFCITDLRNCCIPSDHAPRALGNWFFPNLTRVPSSGTNWDYHRTRGQSVVRLHRRRGGEEGIYRCVIPDAAGVFQTLYIGVYSKDTGKPL